MRYIIFLIFCFSVFRANAQEYKVLSQKLLGGSYGEGGRATTIINTFDKGFLILSETYSTDGDLKNNKGVTGIWLLKFDSNMKLIWQNTYKIKNYWNLGTVCQLKDSNYMVFIDTGSIGSLLLMKISQLGKIILKKGIYGYEGNGPYYLGVQPDYDSGILITAYDGHIGLIQLKNDTHIVWKKRFGGSKSEQSCKVIKTLDKNYAFIGQSISDDGDLTYNHGREDIWIVKLKQDTIIEWQKSYGGDHIDEAVDMVQTPDSGYIFLGNTLTYNNGDVKLSKGGYDIWVVKINSKGVIQWQRPVGGDDYDMATKIFAANDSEYIVTGWTSSHNKDLQWHNVNYEEGLIFKINKSGNIVWLHTYGGNNVDELTSSVKSYNMGYVFVGFTSSTDSLFNSNHGTMDVWLLQLEGNKGLYTQNYFNYPDYSFTLYPNPATHQIFINTQEALNNANISITDITGKEVMQYKNFSSYMPIDVAALPKGFYIISIITKKRKFVGKFVKE